MDIIWIDFSIRYHYVRWKPEAHGKDKIGIDDNR